MITYAQNYEDVLLARIFGGKSEGFYVDVGAHDPEYLSVTKHFYDQGWYGINVEPVPASYSKFVRQRPRDINLAVAVGRTSGTSEIFIPQDAAFATLYPKGDNDLDAMDRLTVPVRSLNSILESNSVSHIDFLNVDVEGSEREVLEGIDLDRFRPVVVLIEATAPGAAWDYEAAEILTHTQWESLLASKGYLFSYFDGLNRYYVREEDQQLQQYFAIPVGPLRDRYRAHADVLAEADLHEAIAQSNRVVELLAGETRRLREEYERLATAFGLAAAARDIVVDRLMHKPATITGSVSPLQSRARNVMNYISGAWQRKRG